MTLSLDDVKKMKVQELRDELTKRGLDSSGLKAALAERLEESMKSDADATAPNGAIASTEPAQPAELQAATNGAAKEEPAPAAELVDGKIVYKDPAEAELEKKKARAARFGVPLSLTEDKKRDIRAQRFGLEAKAGEKRKPEVKEAAKKQPSTAELEAELAKKKARAARFQLPVKTTAEEEKLRLKARSERFKDHLAGLPTATTGNSKPAASSASDIEAKKKARAERFGIKT
ncbi:hypothetical protein CVIRNUC_003052 [Coccomyxa viridis]|uniref:SAP domain-containing protein n=1 Tax=Coccomyxa viridis TaxID=1274662 RepID=A0AAV1I0Q7_9CHLO|nr:hypothetical protein CVIRNUC_003052 [Coccomyxa viridis]